MGLFNLPGMNVATTYGITAPLANKIVEKVKKNTPKDDKKLCRYCGASINLGERFCPQCGKDLSYVKENESKDE